MSCAVTTSAATSADLTFEATTLQLTGAVTGTSVVSSPYLDLVGEVITNGRFDTDTDWTKLNGSTISGGIATVIANGSIDSDFPNWSLTQYDIEPSATWQGQKYLLQFRARQTVGTGNFQIGQRFGVFFDQSLTGSWLHYSIEFFGQSPGDNSQGNDLVFGGPTATDEFELDDVSLVQLPVRRATGSATGSSTTSGNVRRNILDNIIASYRFETLDSNVVVDDIGANNGTNNGAALTASGKNGNGLEFVGDGVAPDDYVDIGMVPEWDDFTEFTVSLDFFPTAAGGSATSLIFGTPYTETGGYLWHIGWTSSNAFRARITDSTATLYTALTTSGLSLNTWHRVVMRWGGIGTPLKVRVKQVAEVSTANVPNAMLTTYLTAAIGLPDTYSGIINRQLNGRVDNIMLWDRHLEDAEIDRVLEDTVYPTFIELGGVPVIGSLQLTGALTTGSTTAGALADDKILLTNPIIYVRPDSIDPDVTVDGNALSDTGEPAWKNVAESGLAVTIGGGTPVLNIGSTGRQVEFAGNTSWFDIVDDASLDFIQGTDDYTVIVRLGDVTPTTGYLVARNDNGTQRQFGIYYGVGSSRYGIFGGNTTPSMGGGGATELWVVTVSGSTVNIWIDGVQEITNFTAGSETNTINSWNIGGRSDGGYLLIGSPQLDIAAIIPKAISTAERQAIESQYIVNGASLQLTGALTTGSTTVGDASALFIPIANLVSYYKLNSELTDAVGNAADASLFGGVGYATGKINNALNITTVGDYAKAPDSSLHSFGDGTTDSPFSVSVWINSNDTGVWYVNKRSGSTCEWQLQRYLGDFILAFSSQNSTTIWRSIRSNAAIPTGWFHLAATYDGTDTGGKIYIDGVDVTSSHDDDLGYVAMTSSTAELYIGAAGFGTTTSAYSMDSGLIQNVAIWDSELTAGNVLAVYRKEDGGEYLVIGSLQLTGAITPGSTTSGDIVSLEALSGSVSSNSVVSGDVVTIESIGGSISTSSSVGGELVVNIGLTGGLSASSVVTGALDFASTVQQLTGSASGSAVTSGDLTASVSLNGTASGVATTLGSLTEIAALSGVSSGVAITSGVLSSLEQLSGSAAGIVVTAGDLTVSKSLSGTATGSSITEGETISLVNLTGNIATSTATSGDIDTGAQLGMNGAITTISTVTGTIELTAQLTASISPSSVVSGEAAASAELTGNIATSTATSGDIDTGAQLGLNGAVNTSSTVTGNTESKAQLTAAISPSSVVSGETIALAGITGVVSTASTTTGSLDTGALLSLFGTTAGSSIANGDLTVISKLSAGANGVATTTGNLTYLSLTDLTGSAAGTSTVFGQLNLIASITGDANGTGVTSGIIVIKASFSGAANGFSVTTGDLTSLIALNGVAFGSSITSTPEILLTLQLQGNATGSAFTSGDLSFVAATSYVNYFNGVTWEVAILKKWNGNLWVNCTMKYWNGSAWIAV